MQQVALAGPADVAGFRHAARRLVAAGVEPCDVEWHTDGGGVEPSDAPLSVPAFFAPLCDAALLHREPGRFALMYRLLFRLQREAALRHDTLDADRVLAERLAAAVRRDIHKTHAFVRFRPLGDPRDEATPHVAWFEPLHHTLAASAPFFARRFARVRWAILGPEASVHWDGHTLHHGGGMRREDAPPADAGEALWLTYYASIFNPARLKLDMMRKEMPRAYWPNLPEAVLIPALSAQATERSGRMVEQGPTVPAKPRPRTLLVAREEPAAAGSLAEIAQALDTCRDCPIGAAATQAVAGQGPLNAALMVVGEQPGDREDLEGRPFVGPAGRCLDRALQALGWPREALYLTNAVKHFKYELRGTRRLHKTAAQREAAACSQWLEREIALVQPAAMLALGATAARSLLGREVAVVRERGQWFTRPQDGRRVLVTLHPAALLRLPPAEFEAAFARWLEDLRLANPL